uniref:Uncharacterized protein n=1 Tax=Aegilops tauschii subsp. strangulata TaxID=200361 RepID=A0A452YBD6_AEGTS
KFYVWYMCSMLPTYNFTVTNLSLILCPRSTLIPIYLLMFRINGEILRKPTREMLKKGSCRL